MNTEGNQGLKSLEGPVVLKRKALWVKRYAKLDNQIFSYKKDKSNFRNIISSELIIYIGDSKTRATIDLRTSKVKYSNRNETGENFIQVQNGDDLVILAFENLSEFDKWSNCFQNQQRSFTDQMHSSQSIPPIQTSKLNNQRAINDSMFNDDFKNQSSARKKGSIPSKFRENGLEESELVAAK